MVDQDRFVQFMHLRKKVNVAKKIPEAFQGRVLALDPGETTGYTCFSCEGEQEGTNWIDVVESGQVKTWPEGPMVNSLTHLIDHLKPTFVVFERYSVYEWKAQTHSWSGVPTIQIIGCLKTLCIQNRLSWHEQTAYEAKKFCTDEKLKQWGLYIEGQKHARDALRHACYFLLFGISVNSTT
jgi:hypothetical protein